MSSRELHDKWRYWLSRQWDRSLSFEKRNYALYRALWYQEKYFDALFLDLDRIGKE